MKAASPQAESFARAKTIEAPARADSAPAHDDLDGVPLTIADRADSMAEICLSYLAYEWKSSRTRTATIERYIEDFNSGEIKVSAEAREKFQLSERTLRRWLSNFKAGGGIAAALKSGYGNRRGHTIIDDDPRRKSFCETMVQSSPRIRAPYLLKAISTRFPDQRQPGISAVKEWLSKYKVDHAALLHTLRDPDGARSSRMFAIGRKSEGVTRFGQIVEIDGSPSDVFTLADGGEVVRLHMLVAIDVFSGVAVILFTRSESSEAIAELILKWIRLYGVPTAFRHDRGAGFLSKRTQRALSRLGIASLPTLPYAGYLKPFVERMIGTIVRGFLENQEGFGGHNVVEKEEIRKSNSFPQRRGGRRKMAQLYNVKLPQRELQDRGDKWVKCDYANQKQAHRGGKCPNELFSEADARGEIKRVDERVLDLSLAPNGSASVTKKGFHIDGRLYWADELIEHQGERLDYVLTADLGRIAVYTAGDAPRFVCIAIDVDAAGLDRRVIAIAALDAQSKKVESTRIERERVTDAGEAGWDRYHRLKKLQAVYGFRRPDSPGGLDESDQVFLKVFEQSPAYRARTRLGLTG
jgi:transposase InsO family protein